MEPKGDQHYLHLKVKHITGFMLISIKLDRNISPENFISHIVGTE